MLIKTSGKDQIVLLRDLDIEHSLEARLNY